MNNKRKMKKKKKQNAEGKKKKMKTANQEYFTQQSCPSQMKKKDFLRQIKAEGVHY
jgi:hypothetical protein